MSSMFFQFESYSNQKVQTHHLNFNEPTLLSPIQADFKATAHPVKYVVTSDDNA